MKSPNLLIILVVLIGCGQTNQESKKVFIAGKYFDQEKPQTIYVRDYAKELGYIYPINLDTLYTDDSGFFSWSIELDHAKEIVLSGDSEFRTLYLEPGDSIYYESVAGYMSPSTSLTGKGSDKIAVLDELNTLLQLRQIAGKDSAEVIPEYHKQVTIYRSVLDSCSQIFSSSFNTYLQSTLVQKQEYILSSLPWNMKTFKKIDLQIDSTLTADAVAELMAFAKNEPGNFDFVEALYSKIAISIYNSDFPPAVATAKFEEKVKELNLTNELTQQLLGMYYLYQMESGNAPELKDIISKFDETYPQSIYKNTLHKELDSWLAISKGEIAPNFKANHLDSSSFQLSDLRGRVVYIDIWATWCGPCISEIPYTKDIKAAFSGRDDIAFLYVSIDTNVDRWKSYLTKHPEMTGIQLNDPRDNESEVYKYFKGNGIPRYLIIDKEGKIFSVDAKRPSQGQELIDQLNEALGEEVTAISW